MKACSRGGNPDKFPHWILRVGNSYLWSKPIQGFDPNGERDQAYVFEERKSAENTKKERNGRYTSTITIVKVVKKQPIYHCCCKDCPGNNFKNGD